MHRPKRHLIVLAALCLAGCTKGAPRARALQPGPVVVAIVVDQLAAWVAAERLSMLPPDGGFARLCREGVWVKDMSFLHAVTETAPGHAALFTGRVPRETRIVGNAVFREDLGRAGSLIEDARTEIVGSDGPVRRPGVSLAMLNGPTVADRLFERDPKATVVALSIKDRAAAFAGGRHPTASIWYDDKTGQLVTSTAFGAALPAWAAGLAHPLPTAGDVVWEPADRRFVEPHAATPDDQPGEATELGGRVFPHRLPPGEAKAKAFRATPMADALLFDLAAAAIDGARRPDHPMLLAISLSANDYIGHAFGPDSWEAWDELLSLDRNLGRFMQALDRKLGPDGYAIVLSGDHGIAPLPEVVRQRRPTWCEPGSRNPYEKPCGSPSRLVAAEIKAKLDEATMRALGASSSPVQDVVEALVFLKPAARALEGEARRTLDDVVKRTLLADDGVAEVFSISDLAGPCPGPGDESIAALVCRATVVGIGDYYIVPKRGSFFWGTSANPEGTSHGSPYRYDRTVPLLIKLPHSRGGTVVDRAPFGAFSASIWYALTGERDAGPYGGTIPTD